jgi:glycosyltransferase involved in cell wall biosynthesis
LFVPKSFPCKIIVPLDTLSESYHQCISSSRTALESLRFLLYYVKSRVYENLVFRRFDACILVSEWDAGILALNVPGIRIHVFHLPVDLERYTPHSISSVHPEILFFGDLSFKSNEESLLYFCKEVLPLVDREVPDAKLIVAGRGITASIVEACAQNPGIRLVGFVEDLPHQIASSSVVVAPMISGTGAKNKILQAMAAGKPVVTTGIGARGIMARNGIDILIADEPIQFAASVISLMKDERLRRRIGANARLAVENSHSAERFGASFLSMVEELSVDKATQLNAKGT